MQIRQSDRYYRSASREERAKSVKVQIVSSEANEYAFTGRFILFGSRRLVISTDRPITPSTAISVEYDDHLFLGEVVDTTVTADASCFVQIDVQHTLDMQSSPPFAFLC